MSFSNAVVEREKYESVVLWVIEGAADYLVCGGECGGHLMIVKGAISIELSLECCLEA